MKFGLVSDIHGDVDALRDAIALLRAQAVDQILCMGDLVERGPFGDAVVELIQAAQITTIAGNHDITAESNLKWFREHGDEFNLSVDGRELTEATLAFLKELPHTLLVPAGDQNILLAHGTPWSEATYLFPGSLSSMFKRVARHASIVQAQVVILGHTHLPMQALINDVHILNPGSVAGTHASGSRSCGVLTLPEFEFSVFSIATGDAIRPSRPIEDYEE